MAGIGFELRKLFREQGLINNVKAYAYSSLTTVGPMILCMFLIIALQRIMDFYSSSYMEWELYIATVSYCFVFSIIFTSGISLVLTRYIADMIYEKKYDRLMSSFYGALAIMLPICAIIAWLFLKEVDAGLAYKFAAYLFFMELIVIWLQGVYLSALKDYMRIVRGFIIGSAAALLSGWMLFLFTDLQHTTAALLGIDIGFFIIVVLSFHHFEQKFPKANKQLLFSFIQYFKRYSSLFFAGCFVYSGVYLHNFVYWLGPDGEEIAGRFLVMSYYDLPVFYAFMSVMPTLVTFVVSVETSFYEKFRTYYLHITNGGTIQDIQTAKKKMQNTLVKEISFLMEVQLLFTVMAIALGIKFFPSIGFTMAQLDLFSILTLAYFLFIIMFVLVHVLMYFDDRKGVVVIGAIFVLLNITLSYWMMMLDYDGLGMFLASFITLVAVIVRLLYVLRNIDYFTFCSQPINQSKKSKEKSFLLKPGKAVSVLLIMTLLLSACLGESESGSQSSDIKVNNESTSAMGLGVSSQLIEDKRLYERDDDRSLKTVYVTILPDKSGSEKTLDWYGLNRLPDKSEDKSLSIIMQEGSAQGAGPAQGMFGYGTTKANGSITLRGRTAWYAPQKSYRIKLHDEAGQWLDQTSFNLNKHNNDDAKFANKLSFDLFETIPNISSLRTQFVNLFVKDLSNGEKDANFVDYGLFTHIEQPNKQFLKAHMLDPNGHLYKASFFEFDRYPDQIKSHNDPNYKKSEFETLLEIKGREEHDKLIGMLDDLNNSQIPIDEVIEKHFDLDNFLTWTAANILMDNMDTDTSNYFLYSPLNSNKWYFLPWDYDGGWEIERHAEDSETTRNGISRYWNSKLHKRYFRTLDNVDKLKVKMDELSKIINKENISKMIKNYRPVVEPFLYRDPDIKYLPVANSEYESVIQRFINTPEKSFKRFIEDIERPKPFFQGEVIQSGNELRFNWDMSYDLQGDDLSYDIDVAKDPLFTQIVVQEKELTETKWTTDKVSPGIYYWRVTARDSHGSSNVSFDYYLDPEGDFYYGMREFEVQ
ncbi:exopolysaccharide Pel transporter PelG [Paenibacillus sp. GSMTC-2017]|uniref:exopolysaccharide Pel transporter PelG n=1 Tax=Paenibacillus sp. GSMTC-2017 TaxID=2794350 RepID=UPI0018D6CE9B|nr:exopolysaccharide Pel transporter PelG [Paenibacillus sp. GSMTC-2017]MBH5320703.1 exopolysaccharide Pel transporter PelG [Paenibacillus sp. GSMTC-2017]